MTAQLGMVAGEASGDLLASLLLQGLRARWPGLEAAGVGGPKMAAQGFDAWWPSDELAVFGYVDALKNLPRLLWLRQRLYQRMVARQPQVFIGVDAPDFNFTLERRLRAAGLRTAHFVCPSIWAWRPERVHTLAAAADLVLCLFPFEPELLARHGVPAVFVGHPLAQAIPMVPPRAAARAALGLTEEATVVALLPGSRRGEIAHIAPTVVQAARLLAAGRPGLQLLLPAAPGLKGQLAPLCAGLPITLLEGRAHEALAAADAAIVASGTATLEAALYKCPMVITYQVAPLNWRLMRGKALQPWFGLPNILSGEFVVPERIQHEATPERLAADVLAWLDDAPRAAALRERFAALHASLRRDTAKEASDAIATLIQK